MQSKTADLRPCLDCGRKFPPTPEHFHSNGRGGFAHVCKGCARIRSRQWYEVNRDRVQPRVAAYREVRREEHRAYFRRYRMEHTDRRRASQRRSWQRHRASRLERKRAYYQRTRAEHIARQRIWQAANPEKVRLHTQRKAHRRRGAMPDAEAIAYMRVLAHDPCSYCGHLAERMEIDHIVPISRGGDGSASNLTAACRDCNNRKSAKSLLTFLGTRSRT